MADWNAKKCFNGMKFSTRGFLASLPLMPTSLNLALDLWNQYGVSKMVAENLIK